MKIVTLKDVVRKDIPIYYRRLYTGVVVLELLKGHSEYRIDFAIETKPTGAKEITVNFLNEVDYPLVPLTRDLKAYIDTLDTNGGLPD